MNNLIESLLNLPYEIFEIIIEHTLVKCNVCWKTDYYHNFYKKMEFRKYNGASKNMYFCSKECYLFT